MGGEEIWLETLASISRRFIPSVFCCRALRADPVFSASRTLSNSRSRLTGVNWLAETFHSRKRCTCYANRVSRVTVKNVMFTIGLPRPFPWINLKKSSRCAGWLLTRTTQGKVYDIMITFAWNELCRMFNWAESSLLLYNSMSIVK